MMELGAQKGGDWQGVRWNGCWLGWQGLKLNSWWQGWEWKKGGWLRRVSWGWGCLEELRFDLEKHKSHKTQNQFYYVTAESLDSSHIDLPASSCSSSPVVTMAMAGLLAFNSFNLAMVTFFFKSWVISCFFFD